MTEYQFYALITVILFFKMFAISVGQGLRPRRHENLRDSGRRAFLRTPRSAADELPIVKRAAMAWRNDLENIPIFLFLGMIYVTLGCSPAARTSISRIFTVARILHTDHVPATACNRGERSFSRLEQWSSFALAIQILIAVL